MAKKKGVKKTVRKKAAKRTAPAAIRSGTVGRNQVGITVQAMIAADGATHVEAVAVDSTAQQFVVTMLA